MALNLDGEPVRWRIPALSEFHWRRWGDDWAVFDVGSGQTHQTDTLTAATLLTLEVESASLAALATSVAGELGIDDDAVLSSRLVELVDRLATLGLIEAAAG